MDLGYPFGKAPARTHAGLFILLCYLFALRCDFWPRKGLSDYGQPP
jgi:hypothetical protein